MHINELNEILDKFLENENLNDNFWTWFGNSKTVKPNGDPIVFYHATTKKFDAFKGDRFGLVYFAKSHDGAREIVKDVIDAKTAKENPEIPEMDMIAVYIKAEKIFTPSQHYELIWPEVKQHMNLNLDPNSQEYQQKLNELTNNYNKIKEEEESWLENNIDKSEEEKRQHRRNVFKAEMELSKFKSSGNIYTEVLSKVKAGHWAYYEQKDVINKIFNELKFDALELSENGQTITTFAVMEGKNQIKSIYNNGNWSNSENIYENSNLNDNFKKWFGNSKVVDENGNPKIVYHGTNSNFSKFNDKKIGSHTDKGMYGRGFYFMDDSNQTYKYGRKTLKVYLRIENPLRLGRGGEFDDIHVYANRKAGIPDVLNSENYDKYAHLIPSVEQVTQFIKEDGYDGIIVVPFNGAETEYIVFNPNQIKSIDNNGDWSNSENIYEDYKNKIFYHGSNHQFDTFDKSKIKENKLGLCFNFTDDYSIAYQYGDHIIKAYLDLNNPVDFDHELTYEEDCLLCDIMGFPKISKERFEQEKFRNTETIASLFDPFKMKPKFIKFLQQLGYDGIAIPEEHHYGVFEPEQIHIIKDDNVYEMFEDFKSLNEQLEKYLK